MGQSRKSVPRDVAERFERHLGDRVEITGIMAGIVSLDVSSDHWLEVCRALRDEEVFAFEQLTEPTPLQARAFQLLGLR